MSRLEEECIVYVGRNRSGIDSGEIDYGIRSYKFDGQTEESLKQIKRQLEFLISRCENRIEQIKNCEHRDYALENERLKMYECRRCSYRFRKFNEASED